MREVEMKFAIHASFAVPAFDLNETGITTVDKLPIQDLRATYYDTPELRLARNGVTLRYRTGDDPGPGWDLKLPVEGEPIARDELRIEGAPRKVPEQAKNLVTAFARTHTLNGVATLHTKRRRWSLKDASGSELAKLMDDEVSVIEGRRVVARFRELELESTRATTAQLHKIAEALREAGAADSEPIPKAVRALGPHATSEPDPPSPLEAGPNEPGSLAVQNALVRGVRRLIRNDPLARLGDPEGVHQMRVAARRLRSDLRTFAPLIDPEWADAIITDLRWLGETLGVVRDLDVMTARLHSSADGLEMQLKPLFEELERRHEEARLGLLNALQDRHYTEVLERLVEGAANPVFTDYAATESQDALPQLVASHWEKLAKAARNLRGDDPDEDFHRVRIQAKKTRYAAEAVAPALKPSVAKEATQFADKVAELQDVLGAHQDSSVAHDLVLEVANNSDADPAFLVAAGQLAERQSSDGRARRASFREVWADLDRKKMHRWLRT
jgi:inorganic triphosphatase YgiF